MSRKNMKAPKQEYIRYEQFYKSLKQNDVCFCLFFTPGLLMFLLRCIEHIPSWVNIILLGANLKDYEVKFIRAHFKHPLFVIEQEGITDQGMLDILLRTHKTNFGYMDVDTFVFNNNLFEKLAQMPSNAIINCYRKYPLLPSVSSLEVCETNFMYFNTEKISSIPVGPFSYSYECNDKWTEAIPKELFQEACSLLPFGTYPYGNSYDTLIFFQLIAIARGLSVHSIQDVQVAEEQDTENFIHMGQCHFVSEIFQNGGLPNGYTYALHYMKVVIIARDLIRYKSKELPSEYIKFEKILTDLINSEPYCGVTRRLEKKLRIRSMTHQDTKRIIYNTYKEEVINDN